MGSFRKKIGDLIFRGRSAGAKENNILLCDRGESTLTMPLNTVTEADLLKISGEKTLQKITELDLSGHGLTEIDPELFNRLTALEELDLMNNDIRTLPRELTLPKLEFLDLSKNDISSIDLVTQFPRLQNLNAAGNKQLGLSDMYIAASLCPTLEYTDISKSFPLQNCIKVVREKLLFQVRGVWDALFKDTVHETDFSDKAIGQLLTNFVSELDKHNYLDDRKLKKFVSFLVRNLAKEIIEEVMCQKENPQSLKRVPKRALKTIHEYEEVEMESPVKKPKTKPSLKNSVKKKVPKPDRNGAQRYTKIKTRPLPTAPISLPSLGDFSPVQFVRCHSSQNDPDDDNTKVWSCAFEPHPENPDKTTQTVATCGGQIVCLLDTQTGKVMKRYRDDNDDESFYCLAWTTVTMEAEESTFQTNLLAVAGAAECIKLIHPQQLLVYSVLKGHSQAIQTLLFHPTEPTQLFSGGNDNKIYLWDIGIPDPVTYYTKYSRLLCLQTPNTGVLSLVYSPNLHWLVAACEDGCFGWNLKHYRKDIRFPTVEFCLPGRNEEDYCVDGLTLLPNNLIATKCVGQPLIQIWSLSDHIDSKSSKSAMMITVNVTCGLKYPRVETPYINLNYNNGIFVVGDEEGKIILYNLQHLVKKKKLTEGLASSSRVLEWPELHYGKTSSSSDTTKPKVVINMSALSSDGKVLVCGTDNNLVCIWNRD